jgi:hypothetical protein
MVLDTGCLHKNCALFLFLHRKKKVRKFPVPSRDVTTKLSLGGNNDVITELFQPRGSLVSNIPAGDGKLVNLFLRCIALCPHLLPQNRITKFSNLLNLDQRGILTSVPRNISKIISQDVNMRESIFLKCYSVLSSFEIRNNFAKLLAEVAVSRKGIPVFKGTGSRERIQILRQK